MKLRKIPRWCSVAVGGLVAQEVRVLASKSANGAQSPEPRQHNGEEQTSSSCPLTFTHSPWPLLHKQTQSR